MTYYESRLRIMTTTRNALVQAYSFAYGIFMCIVSAFATCKEAYFPSPKKEPPHFLLRLRNPIRTVHPGAPGCPTFREAAVLICREGSYSLAIDDTKEELHVPSGATTFIVDSKHSVTLPPHGHHDRGAAVLRRRATRTSIPDVDEAEISPDPTLEAQRVLTASPEPMEEQQSAKSKISGALARLPQVLRLKSKKTSDDGEHSDSERKPTLRNQSSIRRLFPKSEPEEPADAHGRIPYRRNPDDVEMLRTTFVNPFKINTKRARHGSTASTPERPKPLVAETRSPRRNSEGGPLQSLATYMKHAVQPRSSPFRTPLPHRTCSNASLSSDATSSHSYPRSPSVSSSASSGRSHPDRDACKTPPHCHAAPLAGRPKFRRSSGARMAVGVE